MGNGGTQRKEDIATGVNPRRVLGGKEDNTILAVLCGIVRGKPLSCKARGKPYNFPS